MRKKPSEDICCAYRAKLARKKAAQTSRKKSNNVTANCCAGKRLTCDELSKVTAESSGPLVCNGKIKKKIKRIKKQENECFVDIDKIYNIKPTISERERYLNAIHIICVLEEEELIRLKKIQEIREQMQEPEEIVECEIREENVDDERVDEKDDENIEQTSSLTKSMKSEASNEENQEAKSLTVAGKSSEQVAENRNSGVKIKIPKGKPSLETNFECTSICSFDSVVDLTGLHLTKDDVKKIEEDRERARQQQKSECESLDVEEE